MAFGVQHHLVDPVGRTRLERALALLRCGRVRADEPEFVPRGNPVPADGSHPGLQLLDLSATFNVAKSVRLQLGVNNITDKVPPLVVGADCSTSTPNSSGANCNGSIRSPGVYDSMGRYLFAHITAQF